MARECRECKSYEGCIGKPFYNYSEIKFCPHQILWIIEFLEADHWPPNPEGSSYTEVGVKTGYASEGYFVKPAGILGEVNKRLAKAGTSGKLLRAEVLAGLDLSPESKDALMYVKGWRRKKMGFRDWKKQGRYRKK